MFKEFLILVKFMIFIYFKNVGRWLVFNSCGGFILNFFLFISLIDLKVKRDEY